MKFIELHLRSLVVCHGYDENNNEISEEILAENFTPKTIAINRIKSLSEKYVLTDYADGRWIYWEYQESYKEVKNQLLK